MSSTEHDTMLARTSHLPHLVAAVLVDAVMREAREDVSRFCGPGVRDSTRIAAGDEGMWHDVFRTNREAMLAELTAFEERILKVRRMLDDGDFEALRNFLSDARELRQGL